MTKELHEQDKMVIEKAHDEIKEHKLRGKIEKRVKRVARQLEKSYAKVARTLDRAWGKVEKAGKKMQAEYDRDQDVINRKNMELMALVSQDAEMGMRIVSDGMERMAEEI